MTERSNRGGFTLVEVLVALAITALLTMILYTSFSGLTGSAAALNRYSEKYRQIVLFMNQFSGDVTGAFYSRDLPYSNFSLTERNMAGESVSELSFVSFSHQFVSVDPGATDIIRVTYKPGIDDDGNIFIVREIEPNPQVPAYGDSMSETLLTGISSFRILAVTGEDTEDEEWEAESKLKLPDRIAVSIAFTDGGSVKKEFFIGLTKEVSRFWNSGRRR